MPRCRCQGGTPVKAMTVTTMPVMPAAATASAAPDRSPSRHAGIGQNGRCAGPARRASLAGCRGPGARFL